MRLHFGKPNLPGTLRFMSDGYRDITGNPPHYFVPYKEPKPLDNHIRWWLGVSVGGFFMGAIFTTKKEPNNEGH